MGNIMVMLICCLFWGLAAEEPLIIGQGKGEGQLFDCATAKLGPDGLIYVFDRADAFFKVYSNKGDYIRRFGGQGEGPGEVKRPAVVFTFSRNGKSLLWTEYYGGHRWLTCFPLAGGKATVVPIEYEKNRFVGFWGAEELSDGGYLIEALLSSSPEQKGDCFYYSSQHALIRMDATGQVMASFQAVNQPSGLSVSNDGGTVTLPFMPAYEWGLTRDGKILYGNGLSSKLQYLGLDGKVVGELKLDIPSAEPVTDEILTEWREMRRRQFSRRDKGWYNRFGKVIDRYLKSIYGTIPIYDSFRLTPAGNFLVRSYSWREDEPTLYWLFLAVGKRLTHVQVNGQIYDLSERWLLFSRIDEEGEASLYLMPRSGSEVQDLERVGK